ncbi:hypothetical protein [Phenylobacterium sp.]|jgi:hypothetical protein|uniref:hypothetical protein n=1 Tax=Phenylobacterium sp. TaxID=1871053 RepID=UPI002F3E57D1
MTRPATMAALEIRRFTPAERGLARAQFGAALDPDRVRLLALPVWRRAFVPNGRLIVWPAAEALADFGAAGTPLAVQAGFVHELTHVWQAQTGVNMLAAKLRAGDGAHAYAYDLERGPGFGELNIEQQAMVVEHAFLASHGAAAPHRPEIYQAALPDWGRA